MKRCVIFFAALFAAGAAAVADSQVVTVSLWETNVLCLRASRVTENFPDQLRASQPPGRTTGTVLDLRFAGGDSGGADAAVKWFAAKKSPLVILVNSQTRGAAAALAAQLRASASAIVIGSTNPPGEIVPDVAVAASLDDEKIYQDNPCAAPVTNSLGSLAATNNHLLAFVDHTSEAELVRKRIKDGDEDGSSTTPRAEPPQPVIRDPALARAVDLLKALAVLHKLRG
jgi:hypothetical protein